MIRSPYDPPRKSAMAGVVEGKSDKTVDTLLLKFMIVNLKKGLFMGILEPGEHRRIVLGIGMTGREIVRYGHVCMYCGEVFINIKKFSKYCNRKHATHANSAFMASCNRAGDLLRRVV